VSGWRWFTDNVTKSIGNDSKTLFWHEPWLGGDVLKDWFSRLLNLAINNNIFINILCLVVV